MNKYHSSVAHIVYASDDKFAEILGVSLVSLFENSKDMDEIVVYILDSGITDDNKQKLLSVYKTYKRSDIIFIPGKNISEKLSMNVAVVQGSLSQYARLFVSSDLPKELNRVLYLDCDIVVKESIRELWNLDLHGRVEHRLQTLPIWTSILPGISKKLPPFPLPLLHKSLFIPKFMQDR